MSPTKTSDDDAGGGVKGRVRRCVVQRVERPESELVRIAIAPDGALLPDVGARAPGRGAWVSADRASVDEALKKGAFAKSAQRGVRAPDDLSGLIEAQLAARCLAQLGLAKRAGDLVSGFDQVRALVRGEKPAHLIESSDAAADGRHKILSIARAAWGDVPLAGCFGSDELGVAVGRGHVVHAALKVGPSARRFAVDVARLSGFRPLVPDEWVAKNG